MNKFWRFPVRPVERETRNKGSLATEMEKSCRSVKGGGLWEQQGKAGVLARQSRSSNKKQEDSRQDGWMDGWLDGRWIAKFGLYGLAGGWWLARPGPGGFTVAAACVICLSLAWMVFFRGAVGGLGPGMFGTLWLLGELRATRRTSMRLQWKYCHGYANIIAGRSRFGFWFCLLFFLRPRRGKTTASK